MFAALAGAVLAVAAGCGGSSPECGHFSDCGPVGDAVCAGGRCQVFGEADGFGSVKANLSFGRDMERIALSARMWVLLDRTVSGAKLSCAGLGSAFDPAAPENNPLQYEPKYIEFVWQAGGTYFPNLLVQLVRPADRAVFFVEGFSRLQAEGTRTAWGCQDGLSIVKDTVVDSTVTMSRP
ncbi:MAG: hypothetical protein GYA21_06165 [Myxococcales bacterium]|nr:hypothetical protein [Myxococcales bacterium]